MGERPSEYIRDENDWYVEPEWCVQVLKERVWFAGGIHDPCCGAGTIPNLFHGTGADLVDRGFSFECMNFMEDERTYSNIVTNPPYSRAEAIIERALILARYRVAALVQVKFLASQKRHALFSRPEMERVIMFSRRPSMPPGEMLRKHGEAIRGGGSIDFCWAIWNHGHVGPTIVEWVK